MQVIKKTIQYGEHTLTIETGAVARQASGSVMVSMGDTVVLVTAVGTNDPSAEARDFFPLTVNYQEKFYSTGKLPGGFMKREGRPSTKETLTSRLIDRPIRPLFPEGFTNDVQVIATVMSMDPEINPDVPSIIGASAALAISGMPFQGPLAAARVGYKDGIFLLNPTREELKTSALELVVAGTEQAVLMVESEAKELPEETMLEAVMFGHKSMQPVIEVIKELTKEAGKDAWEWEANKLIPILEKKIETTYGDEIKEAYKSVAKQERTQKVNLLKNKVVEELTQSDAEDAPTTSNVATAFHSVERAILREKIIKKKVRIDGRDLFTVRPIDINLGLFPRTHGSAIFTRGETQATVLATLGTERDAQIVDIPSGEESERFMLHYNFPPYATGEVRFMGSPKRREIGHGTLAKRALSAVVPNKEEFPYVVRVVSEITESNGSSSMATVCGGCLSMMDAGVPIKTPVSGIAMGLIKEGDDFVVLTDILGDEDHFGDMDFKVAGTKNGVTALQMDIKITGITKDIMDKALKQAKDGRMHILNLMIEKLAKPRDHVSDFAPRIMTIQINPDKIRDVIGKGGATIKGIVEETGAQIDINDNGTVTVAAVDKDAGMKAVQIIKNLTVEPEIDKIYTGKVVKIMDFGAFVNFLPNVDGLVHISQIAEERVNDVHDYLHEGEEVQVKVLEIDRQGKIRLSIKEAKREENAQQ